MSHDETSHILRMVGRNIWTLDLVLVSTISIICLDSFIKIQKRCKTIVEYGDVIPLSCGIWAFNPNQMAGPDANSKLVPQCRLSSIFV